MSSPPSPARASPTVLSATILRGSTRLWFTIAAIGQLAFIGFILAFYGVRTATGNFAGWNDKPLIDGYIVGDNIGNAVFAIHVLLGSVVTLCGLIQLLPVLRQRAPRVHRRSGRIFMVIAGFEAINGAWLTLVRGTQLSTVSAIAILGDGILILICVTLAWRFARLKQFDQHRKWALRAFMVVSGVWFLRVSLMGWIVVNQGPVGMNQTLSGPADTVIVFACYLVPLAVLQLYFLAERQTSVALKLATAAVVVGASFFTAAGVFGTIAFMWWPNL